MFKKILSSSILCLLAQTSLAASTPIQIESDEASISSQSGQVIHEHNVIMKNGDQILHCDKLTIFRDQDGETRRFVAVGAPALFNLKNAKQAIEGQAKEMIYTPSDQLLVLKGQASLRRGPDQLSGPQITYNIKTEVLQSKSNGQERTRLKFTANTL